MTTEVIWYVFNLSWSYACQEYNAMLLVMIYSTYILLSVPRVSLQMTTRGFPHAAPSTWNSLDLSVRSIPTLPAFKCHLKTYLMSADHSST